MQRYDSTTLMTGGPKGRFDGLRCVLSVAFGLGGGFRPRTKSPRNKRLTRWNSLLASAKAPHHREDLVHPAGNRDFQFFRHQCKSPIIRETAERGRRVKSR